MGYSNGPRSCATQIALGCTFFMYSRVRVALFKRKFKMDHSYVLAPFIHKKRGKIEEKWENFSYLSIGVGVAYAICV